MINLMCPCGIKLLISWKKESHWPQISILYKYKYDEEFHLEKSAPSRNAVKTNYVTKEPKSKVKSDQIISVENILPTTCSSVQEWMARFGRSCQTQTEEQNDSHHVHTAYCHPQNIQPVLISVQISADLSVLSTRTLNSFIFDSVIIQYLMLICKEKHIGIIPYFHKKYAIIKKCSLKVLLMH